MLRVGIGYDVHQYVPGRPLILGGVLVPFELGLDGHSDADVLVHAVMDAILGAAGAGDIGRHFPASDNQYKNISSLQLLKRVLDLIHASRWEVGNIDAVLVAQAPRLAPYLEQMRQNIARVLVVDPAVVNIKATTTEGLGFTGRGEGVAAQAVASLYRDF